MPPTDRPISSGKPLAAFVGALTADLETTRNAVVDAVLRAHCRPLGNEEAAGEYLKRAYRCAWADGPPYSHRYYLERCRVWMKHLHLPELRLPEFHGIKAEPTSFEEELREIAAWSKARRAE